jgi:hypothetical protein
MMRTRVPFLLVLTSGLLAAAAAGGVEVSVDFDPTVDFSRFETFGWLEGTQAEDEELEHRIHASIERELVPLGFKEVREDPDLLIVTHASIDREKEIDVTKFDYWLEYQGWKRPMAVSQGTWNGSMGVLIVDLLDATSRRLIWRGMATGNVAKKPEKRSEKLDATMAKLFRKFPPN